MREPTLLRVEWVDSDLWVGWQDAEDVKAAAKLIITVGFKVKEEEGFLYVANSWNPNPRRLGWAGVTAIPVRAIVKKKRIGH